MTKMRHFGAVAHLGTSSSDKTLFFSNSFVAATSSGPVEHSSASWRDIRDRIVELECNPHRHALLAKARRRLAQALGQPRTLTVMRLERGFSLPSLAQRCGISKGDLGQIEAGEKDPPQTILNRLAEELDVPIDVLAMAIRENSRGGGG